jgi:hypothetical protein
MNLSNLIVRLKRWLNRDSQLRRDSRTKETILWYRHTYEKDQQSKWAFARLLESGGIFRPIENEQQRAAHNQIVYLLENMGMVQGVNYDRLAELLLTLTIPEEAVDK